MKVDRDNGFIWRDTLRIRGRAYPKTYKDRIVIQKWPRGRGSPKTALAQSWVNHFSCLADTFKDPEPLQYDFANQVRGGSRWLPRDVFYAAASGQLVMGAKEVKINTPTVTVHRAAAESLTSGVAKTLTPDVEDWDNNQFWSPSVNPTRITFRSPGLYWVNAKVQFNAVTGSFRDVIVRLNGSSTLDSARIWPATANGAFPFCSFIWYFEADQWIDVQAQANTTGVTARLQYLQAMAITPENIHQT